MMLFTLNGEDNNYYTDNIDKSKKIQKLVQRIIK